MNELRVFSNAEFGDVRTVIIDGEPWLVGVDVAKSLAYQNPSKAINTHCKHTRMEWMSDTVGRRQQLKVIPEGDLYRLIVKAATQSNSKEVREKAERFESWIFDEVLPSLRQNGTYTIAQKQDSYMIEDPAERARRWAEEYEEKVYLEQKVRELSPKAEMHDKILDASLLVNFRDAAKEIGISQSQFTGWLKENGYVYANSAGELRPMEQYMESDFFQMKPYQNPYNGFKGSRTYITGRGLAAFKILLDTSGYNRDTMKKHGGRNKRK